MLSESPRKRSDKDSFIDEYELNEDEPAADEPDLTVDIPEGEPAPEKATVEPVFDEEFLAEPEEVTEEDSSDIIGDDIGKETEEPVMEKKSVFSFFGKRKNKEKPAPEAAVTDDADLLADIDDDTVTVKLRIHLQRKKIPLKTSQIHPLNPNLLPKSKKLRKKRKNRPKIPTS